MECPVEIWLRGDNHATTAVIDVGVQAPSAWSDADVAVVLAEMLRAIDRAKHPDATGDRPVSLRGFSWIVNKYEDGVVIALELTLGAVVAGPFDIPEPRLTAMIERAIAGDRVQSVTVH